jgi:hypothetical protein
LFDHILTRLDTRLVGVCGCTVVVGAVSVPYKYTLISTRVPAGVGCKFD